MPGLTVLDRDLHLDDGRRADVVAVDAGGRLTLIVSAEHGDEELFLAAVAAVTKARTGRTALVKHLRARQVRLDCEPLVLVIARHFDASTRERLMALDARAVSCCEWTPVETQRGRSQVFSALREVESAPATGQQSREAAHDDPVGERLAKLDDELAELHENGARRWRWREHELCSVRRSGERTLGSVASLGESFALENAGEVERFFDAVVRRYVALSVEPAEPRVTSVAAEIARLQHASVMTPDEIAAFQTR